MNLTFVTLVLAVLLGRADIKALPNFQEAASRQKEVQAVQYQTSQTSQKKQIWITITAYSSEPDQTDSTPFITASGKEVRDGIVAANFLDFGAQLRIPELFGDKTFEVQDRLNTRFSDRIDIWMPTAEEAKKFGKQYALVEITQSDTE